METSDTVICPWCEKECKVLQKKPYEAYCPSCGAWKFHKEDRHRISNMSEFESKHGWIAYFTEAYPLFGFWGLIS